MDYNGDWQLKQVCFKSLILVIDTSKIVRITTKWILDENKINWSEVMMVRRHLGEASSPMAPRAPRLRFQECSFYQAGSSDVDILSFLIIPSLQYSPLRKLRARLLKYIEHSLG